MGRCGVSDEQIAAEKLAAKDAELIRRQRAELKRLQAENERLWAVYQAADKLLNDGCVRGSERHLQLEQAIREDRNNERG